MSVARSKLLEAAAALQAAIVALADEEAPAMIPTETEPLMYTIPAAAERIGISRTAAFGFARTGELETITRAGVGRRVTAEALQQFVGGLERQSRRRNPDGRRSSA